MRYSIQACTLVPVASEMGMLLVCGGEGGKGSDLCLQVVIQRETL